MNFKVLGIEARSPTEIKQAHRSLEKESMCCLYRGNKISKRCCMMLQISEATDSLEISKSQPRHRKNGKVSDLMRPCGQAQDHLIIISVDRLY